MRTAGFAAFGQIEVWQHMHGYGDLSVLAEIRAELFLVTSGFRRLQESEIEALWIAQYYTDIHTEPLTNRNPRASYRRLKRY